MFHFELKAELSIGSCSSSFIPVLAGLLTAPPSRVGSSQSASEVSSVGCEMFH